MNPTVTKDNDAAMPTEVAERTLRADARRNHERILRAARSRFAEEGLDAQMEDVARAAGVGVGTIYRHFPTKEDLIAALAADWFARLAARAHEALTEDDPWEGLRGFIRFSAEIQVRDRGLCEVMGSRPDIMGAAAEEAGLDELCMEMVNRAQQTSELRQDLDWEDIPMIACGLGRIVQADAGPAAGRWERFLGIVLDGLRAPSAEKLPAIPAD
jgi:AcrR family transcriptional regulator